MLKMIEVCKETITSAIMENEDSNGMPDTEDEDDNALLCTFVCLWSPFEDLELEKKGLQHSKVPERYETCRQNLQD